jgi:hypothetical protein
VKTYYSHWVTPGRPNSGWASSPKLETGEGLPGRQSGSTTATQGLNFGDWCKGKLTGEELFMAACGGRWGLPGEGS